MITVSRENFPDIIPPEFRPGVDTVILKWDTVWGNAGEKGLVVVKFSGDGGTLWEDIYQETIDSNIQEVRFTAPASFEVSWPIGYKKARTHDGIFELTLFNLSTNKTEIDQAQTDKVVIASWPDRYIKTVFPEKINTAGMSPTSLVILAMGSKNLTPPAYPIRISSTKQLDSLFPPNTSAAIAWRMANFSETPETYIMRAGDINDFNKYGGPGTPLGWQYLYLSLEECYMNLERYPAGVVCPVDAVVDLNDFGLGNKFAAQLSEFCMNQSYYRSPVIGVIPTSTVADMERLMGLYNFDLEYSDGTPSPIRMADIVGGISVNYTATPIDGISLIGADSGNSIGIGILEYDPNNRTLSWGSPGDTIGAPITVAADGRFTLISGGGARLYVYVQKLPSVNDIVIEEVKIAHINGSLGSKFIIPVFGYTDIVYNDPITGIQKNARKSIAASVASMLSMIPETADPLHKKVFGLGPSTSTLYEGFISLLVNGGANTVRKTISKGFSLASGTNAAIHEDVARYLAEIGSIQMGSAKEAIQYQMWGSIKNVRIVGQIIREMKGKVENQFIGEHNVKASTIEGTMQRISNKYIGSSIESGIVSVVRDTAYTATARYQATPIGTIGGIVSSFLIGA